MARRVNKNFYKQKLKIKNKSVQKIIIVYGPKGDEETDIKDTFWEELIALTEESKEQNRK